MVAHIWAFLHNADNRAILSWFGGGFVVLAGGIWVIFKFAWSEKPKSVPPAPTVQATEGAVAAGRDIRDSKIEIGRRTGR